MSSWRRNNLSYNKPSKNDNGGFETTFSAFRKHRQSSSSFVEDSVSADRRRLKRVRVNVPPPPLIQQHLDTPSTELPDFRFDNVPDMQWEDNAPVEDEDDEDEEDTEDRAQKARRYASSDEPMQQWLPFRSAFAAEFMRGAGRGGFEKEDCSLCGEKLPLYRCKECFSPDLTCAACTVKVHADNPLHVVEQWTGTFFSRTTLNLLGLRVQLGHARGQQCRGSRPAHRNFMIYHTNGIHTVSLDYCLCQPVEEVGDYWRQLMRRKWFPGSVHEPRTACTFEMLELFHRLTLQGKMSLYDFYAGLEKLSDNTGTAQIKFRYPVVARIVRQYRYLKMILRAGVASDPSRNLDSIRPGELAVLCPACPRPDVNLPPGWESTAREQSFIYFLFLSVDACFRLKRRNVSSEKKDPGLATGAAYFVPDEPFREFLLHVTDQKELSTCSGLAALEQANTKFNRGYATTGAGVCVCGRHEMVQPEGAVDLQKGERYVNMDYLLASVLLHHDPRLKKVFSYDINCQYSKNLVKRLALLPPRLRLRLVLAMFAFVIPKLHIKGHARLCQAIFSLILLFGAGMTDAEGIERQWANLGPVATTTREMGPGYRHDTLDDHMSDWNWQKTVRLGHYLHRRLRDANEEYHKQHETFTEFCEQQSESAEQWKAEVISWEVSQEDQGEDRPKNPFTSPQVATTENDVRNKHAVQEALAEESGVVRIHDISPSGFIVTLLELEDQQRKVKAAALAMPSSPTTQARTALIERRTRLQRGIAALRSLQATYTPTALQELRKTSTNTPLDITQTIVEEIPLLPPTALAGLGYSVSQNLLQIEIEFREAQLETSLDSLRNQLFVKSRLLTQKDLHARHQGATTRARGLLDVNQTKIAQHAAKYRAAWEALKRGYGNDETLVLHRKLLDSDIVTLGEDVSTAGARIQGLLGQSATIPTPITTGSRANVSWIWLSVNSTSSDVLDAAIAEAVRVEFCRAYARERRWNEEQQLLVEEQRRTLVTLRWEAEKWRNRVVEGSGPDIEGRNAYSLRQAYIRENMASVFEDSWATPLPPAKPRGRVMDEPTEGEFGDAPLEFEGEQDFLEGDVDPLGL